LQRVCTPMIQTTQLTKLYGRNAAVDGISFRVEPGEVLGFLGPNGAGKSTTMKMIAGFLTPSSGSVEVCGHDVVAAPKAAKRLIGYLPEGAPSYGEMSTQGFLGFVARARNLGGEWRAAVDRAVQRLELGGVVAQPIDTLSKGFRRRVGLAAAILHDPPVLVLDEPTDGLDPNQKHEVRDLIREMSRERTIIISTHILEEVESVCTRAIIIARGRLLADDTPDALMRRSRYNGAVSLSASDSVNARVALEGLDGVDRVEFDPSTRRLVVVSRDGRSLFEPVSRRLAERGVAFGEMQLERGRLDEVFRRITLGEEARDTRARQHDGGSRRGTA
jgi:ABC-2 type transport system ATP-binding protein